MAILMLILVSNTKALMGSHTAISNHCTDPVTSTYRIRNLLGHGRARQGRAGQSRAGHGMAANTEAGQYRIG